MSEKPPSTMTCQMCNKDFKLFELAPNKGSKWGVSKRCKPCDSDLQAEQTRRRLARQAAQVEAEQRTKAMRANDPAWASPRTLVGKGIYQPQPWTVREGALAYRSVPSRGIGV